MSRRREGDAGFTIAELVVSLVLLSVTLTTFMSVSATTSRLSLQHAYLTQAITVGEMVTEELLMMGANHANLAEGDHALWFDRAGLDTTQANAVYTVSWTVSDFTVNPAVTQIDVTISWVVEGETRQVSWTTYRQ